MHDPAQPMRFVPNLLNGGWRALEFEPFRDGIEVFWLRTDDPSVALLRYAAGASVPEHLHTGLETIMVLEGSQSDERGTYTAGSLVLNPKGSTHSVWSDTGCTVLIEWEKPVQFLDSEET